MPPSRIARTVFARLPGIILAFGLPLLASYALLALFPQNFSTSAAVFADGETTEGQRAYLDLALSRPVLERVIRRSELRDDIVALAARDPASIVINLFKRVAGRQAEPDPRLAADHLRAAVSVRPLPEANVLAIGAVAPTAGGAARIADAMASAFVEEAMGLQRGQGPRGGRGDELQRAIAQAESALALARRQPASPARAVAPAPAPPWEQFQRDLDRGIDIDTVAARIGTPALERLRRDFAEAQAQEAALRASLGQRHPSWQEANQLVEERRKLLGEAVRLAIAAGRAGVTPTATSGPGQDIRALERDLERARAAYDAYLRSPDGQADGRAARILRPALVPMTPDGLAPRLIWFIGLAASLLFGLGAVLAAILALRRQRRDWRPPPPAARDQASTGVSAQAPPPPSAKAGGPVPAGPSASRVDSADAGQIAEELSARAGKSASKSALQTCVVTGTDPDRITTTAIAISGESAQRHLRVLLLDGSEAQPTLSRRLRDAPVSGLIQLHGRRRPLASFEPTRGAPVWLAPALSSVAGTDFAGLPLIIPALAGHFDLLIVAAPALDAGVGAMALAAAGETVVVATSPESAPGTAEVAARLGVSPDRLRFVGEGSTRRPARPGRLIKLDLLD